tara:strand:+ start:591 stop:923 length:333 start_codon:yes stop_codon:yes gene_type:complete
MPIEQIVATFLVYGISLAFVAFLGWFIFIVINERCKRCNSLKHHFLRGRAFDSASGHAYFVCKACGHRTVAGDLGSDGRVHWYTGGTGSFLEDGTYFGDFGGGGGGGGDG